MSEVTPRPPQPEKRKRSRQWVFTLNNYTEENENRILHLFEEKQIRYFCFGREVGEQGTPHLQGYIQLFNPKDLQGIKKQFGTEYHFEIAQGTPEECIAYCKKDGVYFENGECKTEGQRTDILKLLSENQSYKQILENPENVKNINNYRNTVKDFYKFQSQKNQQWDYPKIVTWLAGETGCGKTKFIVDWCKGNDTQPSDVWFSSDTMKWFDGYNGQKVAVLDDFRKESCSFNFLLRILDRYPLRVPIKGDYVIWNPQYIFITCPRIPQFEFVAHDQNGLTRVYEDVEQINRRCHTILEYDKQTKEFEIIK